MSDDSSSPREWTVLSMLEWATKYFGDKDIPSPRLSIEWLLSDLLGCRRLDLYLKFDRPLSPEELALLKPAILRRTKHEPLQYIVGKTDFYGLEIATTSAALIPRPETEQLVEQVLNDHSADEPLLVLDIGTGSGCIPIALKHERPNWNIIACDISEQALKLARENASSLGLDIQFVQHDLFNSSFNSHTQQPFDIIISNPPYISSSERQEIDREVRDYEPAAALFHDNVKSVYRAIARLASGQLKPSGKLYIEIHENMGEDIQQEIRAEAFSTTLKTDYSGKQRFIIATRTHKNKRTVDNL